MPPCAHSSVSRALSRLAKIRLRPWKRVRICSDLHCSQLEGLAVAISWGFESPLPHQPSLDARHARSYGCRANERSAKVARRSQERSDCLAEVGHLAGLCPQTPYTLTRSALRRLSPFAWRGRCARPRCATFVSILSPIPSEPEPSRAGRGAAQIGAGLGDVGVAQEQLDIVQAG